MRKRWTPREEVTEEVLNARERQKCQIALRRYLIEGKRSPGYAPYFGLDIKTFREWIEIQFTDDLNWDNFSTAWKLDYVIPLSYFNLADPDEMKLGCSFINIRVQPAGTVAATMPVADLLTAKRYFERLVTETGYPIAELMVKRIEEKEALHEQYMGGLIDFVRNKASHLADIAGFSPYQFEQLNLGMSLREIIEENKLLNKMTRL